MNILPNEIYEHIQDRVAQWMLTRIRSPRITLYLNAPAMAQFLTGARTADLSYSTRAKTQTWRGIPIRTSDKVNLSGYKVVLR